MDGTLTDSMTVVWPGAPLELLRRKVRGMGGCARCPAGPLWPHPKI